MTVDPVSLAITVALTAAQMAMTMSRKIEGPRQESLDVTVADYGTALNYFKGMRRFAGVPIIWAEPIREVKRRSKTKGGKYSEYSYFGSWAVAVADHEIDSVTRIWFDKHLVYDVTGAGPMHPFTIGTTQTANKGKSTATVNVNLGDHLRIYLGTETQTADPRMVADVEAKHGANSCPDYKGVAYIVFEEIPLEKFGNRMPQISVEAVTNSEAARPYETFDIGFSNGTLAKTIFSKDGNWLTWSNSAGEFEIWYMPTRTLMRKGNRGFACSGIAWHADGTMIGIAGSFWGLSLFTTSRDGVVTSLINNYFGSTVSHFQSSIAVVTDGNGVEHWATTPPPLVGNYFWLDGAEYNPTAMGYSGRATFWFADAFGDIWTILTNDGSTPSIRFLKMVDVSFRGVPTLVTVGSGLPNAGSLYPTAQAIHFGDDTHDHFVLAWEGNLYAIDCTTGAVGSSNTTVLYDVYNGDNSFGVHRPGDRYIWLGGPGGGSQIDLADLTEAATFDPLDWKNEDTDGFIYSTTLDAIIGFPSNDNLMTIYYLNRPAGLGVTLEELITDISDRCNIDPALIEASEMDQLIHYSWTRGSGRDILEPVLDAHDSICRPHDFGIEFIKLGRASLGTLSVEDFVAERGERARYDILREQDTDLPRRVTVSFSDLNADQQPNVAMDQRGADTVDSVRELTINLGTMAMTPNEAQQLTERWLRRRWFGRETYGFSVTASELALEPGDVYDIDFDGLMKRARITGVTIEKRGALNLELRRDDPLISSLSGSAGQPNDGHLDEVLLIPMPTKAFLLDATLIQDGDESAVPFLYLAAGPQAAGVWLGATVFEARDGVNYDAEVGSVPTYFPATWGYCLEALYDVPTCGLWDRGAGVNVRVPGAALTSITRAEADADLTLNRIIFESGEQIQYLTATLEADGSYTLTGLRRGRRGTEWASGLHTAGEAFVLIDAMLTMDRGASDIAAALYFKAIGSGDPLESASPIVLNFAARAHKPYAPARLEAVKQSSGDWLISAVRRTRVGGAWTGGGTIPLGENSEAYELDLSNGSTIVTKAISSFPYTWSAAQQTTDMGGAVAIGDLDVTAYQMSDLAGRGFPAAGSF